MTHTDPQLSTLTQFFATRFGAETPDHIGVAVSGGGDSLALLRLMATWGARQGVRISAVTVDHGLRAEAAEEAAFVGETCAALDIAHTTLTWTDWSGAGNLQDAARRARYKLMADWARAQNITAIVLGHTLDDQAETFFMRLARASGIDGLSGMQEQREAHGITWLRPLLTTHRADLRQYLRGLDQAWIDDPSNDDEVYDRVKARKAMAALSDLGVDAQIVGRVMAQLGQVRSALDHATHAHACHCMRQEMGDLVIDRAAFVRAPEEVNRRLVSHALRWIASTDYGPRASKLQAFMSAMVQGKDATLHGVRLVATAAELRLFREYAAVEGEILSGSGIWDKRWRIACDKSQEFIVRALGDDGLAQLGPRTPENPPRESLKSTPAVFSGDILVAAPMAVPVTPLAQTPLNVSAKLIYPQDHVFTSLLSH